MSKEQVAYILDRIIYYVIGLYALTLCFALPVHFEKIAFGLAIIRLCLLRNTIQVRRRHLYFIGAFLIALLPSIFFNEVSQRYLFGLDEFRTRFLSSLVLLFVLITIQFTKEQIRNILILACLSLFINDFVVIWQGVHGILRPAGIAGSCMFVGGIILLMYPIFFTAAFEQAVLPGKWANFFAGSMVFVTLIAAVYNATRITWIGVAVITLFLLPATVKNRKKYLLYLCIIGLCCSLFFVFNHSLQQRLQSIANSQNQSNSERVLMWQSAWHMFKDHPIVGVGVGNYKDQFESVYKSPDSKGHDQVHPHNVLLSILSQAGILGGTAYLAMFLYFLYESFYNWRSRNNVFALMFFSLTIGYLINSLTDCVFGGPFLKPLNDVYWFLLGCYLIMSGYVEIHATTRVYKVR